MHLPIYQVDAFADAVFAGNPAAVCPLQAWLPDDRLQAIASENNLSETAFFVVSDRDDADFDLRWFTPACEVPLCGHATLAAAHVLLNVLGHPGDRVVFSTRKSGLLTVTRQGEHLQMDFPVWTLGPADLTETQVAAIGARPTRLLSGTYDVAVFETADEVAALDPDMSALVREWDFALVCTAPGTDGVDFVSRMFAPAHGIPEDPVTGSAHCLLIPYWAERLGKTEMVARQISKRGGTLHCTLKGDRVTIAGAAVLYLTGTIYVD